MLCGVKLCAVELCGVAFCGMVWNYVECKYEARCTVEFC